MPLLAALAVALCSMLVLTAWSIMGGFLSMLLSSGSTMVGDVSVTWPNAGFGYYEDFIQQLEADKSKVAAACPLVETYGVVSLPDDRVEPVQVKGVDPIRYSRVVGYSDSLWWKPINTPEYRDSKREDPRLNKDSHAFLQKLHDEGMALRETNPATQAKETAAVVGIELLGLSRRDKGGYYSFVDLLRTTPTGTKNTTAPAFDSRITIRVVPMDTGGRVVDLVSWTLPVANEYRTGIYEVDRRTIIVPLAELQSRMKMDASLAADATSDPYLEQPRAAGIVPARVNTVLVKAAPGVSPDELRAHVIETYRAFAIAHAGKVPALEKLDNERFSLIRTWEMTNATFVGAVKKETAVVLFLLSLMWIVCAVLILTIFWAMISEKTKDIGILRSMGASGAGVAWLWVRYGFIIGLVGTLLGLLAAYLIVTNINPIHEWFGSVFGVYIWDPKVYYFAELPSRVEPKRALTVLAAGVFFSVLGALVPAWRAARMKPVESLRFE